MPRGFSVACNKFVRTSSALLVISLVGLTWVATTFEVTPGITLAVSSSLPWSETVLGFKSISSSILDLGTCNSVFIALSVIGFSTCRLPSCMNVYVLGKVPVRCNGRNPWTLLATHLMMLILSIYSRRTWSIPRRCAFHHKHNAGASLQSKRWRVSHLPRVLVTGASGFSAAGLRHAACGGNREVLLVDLKYIEKQRSYWACHDHTGHYQTIVTPVLENI